MNPETFRGVAVSALVSAAVSFGMLHLAAPAAHARSADNPLVPAAEAPRAPRARLASEAGSSEIHEAYSDGGYWDWMEKQHAMP